MGLFIFNSFSFQRMGTKDRVGESTGCIMHRVRTSNTKLKLLNLFFFPLVPQL
jgi:hypothetical protein